MKPLLIVQMPNWALADAAGVKHLCEIEPRKRLDITKQVIEETIERFEAIGENQFKAIVVVSRSTDWKFELCCVEKAEFIDIATLHDKLLIAINPNA